MLLQGKTAVVYGGGLEEGSSSGSTRSAAGCIDCRAAMLR